MLPSVRDIRRIGIAVVDLRREVRSLRSLVISLVGDDREGRYRAEFVREILHAAREQPNRKFTDAATFLTDLRRS